MALAGYNPNVSLLPSGNGPIQAMSGGAMGAPPGYNPTVSLLPPSTGGDINSYRGGFMNEPIQLIPNSSTLPSPLIGGAAIPKGIKESKITSDSIEVTWDNFDPAGKTYSGKAYPPTPAPPLEGKEPEPVKATISARIDYPNKLAIFEKLAPNTKYKIVLFAGKLSGAETPEFTTLPKTDNVPKDAENKPKENNGIHNDDKSKPIRLFGTPIQLTNPKKMTSDKLTDDQITALQKFGLDGPGLSTNEKFKIITALYEGKCDTDQPMIFLQNCEPIRRIVQALALNLLEKLEAKDSEEQLGIKKDDQPTVEFKPTPDGGMSVCLTFKKDQLGLISKFVPKNKSPNGKRPSGKGPNESIPKGKGPNNKGPDVPPPPPEPVAPSQGSIKVNIEETHTDTTIISTFAKALKENGSVDSDVTYTTTLKKSGTNASNNGALNESKNSEDGKTTTITFSNLKPATDYTIEVVSKKGNTIETATKDVKTNDASPPANNNDNNNGPEIPPAQIAVEIKDLAELKIHTDKIAVIWTRQPDVKYVAKAEGKGNTIDGDTTKAVTDNEGNPIDENKVIGYFKNLESDTDYTITITATSTINSTKSATETINIKTKGEPPVNPPIKPEGLYIYNKLKDTISINWNALEGVIYTASAIPTSGGDSINGAIIDLEDGTGPIAHFNKLALNTEYKFTITATKGNQTESSDITETTEAAAPPPSAPSTGPIPTVPDVPTNSIEPGEVYLLEEPLINSMIIGWTYNDKNEVEYTAIATPTDGGDAINGTIKSEAELPELGKYAEFTGLAVNTKYTITITAKKGNIEKTSTGEFSTASAEPAIGNLAPPILTIVKVSDNSFKVIWLEQTDATYDIKATMKENNNGEETEVSTENIKKFLRFNVVLFENMKPGVYTVTLTGKLGNDEQTVTKSITLDKNNNSGSTISSNSNNSKTTNSSITETNSENNSENIRIIIAPEYKKCKFSADELNTKFPIIQESIANSNGNTFDVMKIPDDGWCLYMAALLSKEGKFTQAGSAYKKLPEVINNVAQYLRENETELSGLYNIGRNNSKNNADRKVTYQTQPINGDRKNVETLADYIKYLITPRESYTEGITIPADAYVRCKEDETNGNKVKEYFVFEDEENEVKYIPLWQGPAVWPDLQIIGNALSHALGEPIFVFQKDETSGQIKQINKFKSDGNTGTTGIYLLFNGTNHYESLLPKFEGIPTNLNNATSPPAPSGIPNYKPTANNLEKRKKLADNAAKKAERTKPGPEPSLNSQGIFGPNSENNFENSSEVPAAPTASPTNYKPTPNNLEKRKKLAENVAKKVERTKPGPEPSLNSQGIFGPNSENNFEGPKNVPIAPIAPTDTKQNKPSANRKYSKQNIRIFQQKMNSLTSDLKASQRTQRNKKRAENIRKIASNRASLNSLTGQSSNVIKKKINKIKETYKNINKNGHLDKFVGGKKKTFKKAALKRKHLTMKKQRK